MTTTAHRPPRVQAAAGAATPLAAVRVSLLLVLGVCLVPALPMAAAAHPGGLTVGDPPAGGVALSDASDETTAEGEAGEAQAAVSRPPEVVAHAGGRSASRSLVIVLHGGSWTGATPEELARRAIRDLHDEARRAKLRLLAPEGPEAGRGAAPWLTEEGERRVLALVDRELATGKVAADRITLAGHGAGATGALELAARHPRRFAAVAVWSGTPPPLWDAEGQVVGLGPDPVPGLAGVPVYLWTGDDDPILDRAALELFVTGMRAAGPTHTLEWQHGPGGHDLGRKGPRAGLRFLARHRLKQRP